MATCAPVALLRRVLYLDALVRFLGGLALIFIPRLLMVDVAGQRAYPDYTLVREAGVASIALALLMVLVGHRVRELWWWAWAFVVLEGGTAIVQTLRAAFGPPEGAAAWWAFAAVSWVFTFGFLIGIARAGTEAPPQ